MHSTIKIMIIGDERLLAEKITMHLIAPDYEVCGVLSDSEEIFQHVKIQKPDIILLDMQLKGQTDAIQTAEEIKKQVATPIIFLISETNQATFSRAIMTRPAAFISKPFKKMDLQRAIELAIFNYVPREENNNHSSETCDPVILSDRIFVHCRDKMIKIMVSDILYIEADRNYSRIFTPNKEYLLSTTLKTIELRLPKEIFIRIHRSFIVNISLVDEVGESYVLIKEKHIPLSAALKEQLMKHLKTI